MTDQGNAQLQLLLLWSLSIIENLKRDFRRQFDILVAVAKDFQNTDYLHKFMCA